MFKKCLKLLIFSIVFLNLINITLSIKPDNDTFDMRFDYGYITFNHTQNLDAKGMGKWIFGLYSNLTSNVTFFIPDTTNPNVTLIAPSDDYTDDNGIISFQYNVTDASNITNCTLYIEELDQLEIDSNPNRNETNTITVSGLREDDWKYWLINCTDASNNVGNSSRRRFKIVLIGSPPTGGRGGPSVNITKEAPIIGEIKEIIEKRPSILVVLGIFAFFLIFLSNKDKIVEKLKKKKLKKPKFVEKLKKKKDKFMDEGW